MAKIAKLKVVEGFLRDKDIVLGTEPEWTMTFGRDKDCTIQIMSRRVNHKHVRITFRNGVYAVTPLPGKNDTLLKGQKLTTTCVLRPDDLIDLGPVKLRFVLEEPAPPPQPATNQPKPAPPAPPKPVVIPPKPTAPAPPPVVEKKIPEEIERPVFSAEEMRWVGRTVGGVKLIAALGKGRRTVVYKGTWAAHNQVVAFKTLSAGALANPDVVRWLVTSVRRAAELRHESALPLLGGGREGDTLFVFTRYMENGSAQEMFFGAPEEGVPLVKLALETLVHTTRALEFAQAKRVLHLGLRPSKVLFDEGRHAKLNGLGFDNTPLAPGATMTPDVETYLAPEQIEGRPVSAATDVFSLGATFYYMLTGRRPVRDRRQRIPSPKLVNKAVPDSICRIIEKMLDPDPQARYSSYGQLLHDVRWALRGEAWPHA